MHSGSGQIGLIASVVLFCVVMLLPAVFVFVFLPPAAWFFGLIALLLTMPVLCAALLLRGRHYRR